MLQFSKRAVDIQASPIRKLSPLAAEAELKGKKVYHLNIGQPDVKTPDFFFNAVKNFNQKVLSYVDSQGLPETIESFRKYYRDWGIDFDYKDIIITNGGSEAVLFAIMAVADYGDEILIPEPFYANYNSFSALAGVNVVTFETRAEEGFHLPPEEKIEKYISSRTRAILFSNPGNPTGVIYTREEMNIIADLARKHNLFIIADEVYREFVYDDIKYLSFMQMPGIDDRVILVDSVSKRYSACGARVGLVASHNKKLMPLILKFAQSRLCISTIDQIGTAALINTSKEYFAEVAREYQHRRDVVYDALQKIPGVVCQKPSGAFYFVVKLPVDDAEDFVRYLLADFDINNETVMLAPADGFYATPGLGKDEVRISYCIDDKDLKKAMNILEKGLKSYNNR